MKPGRCQVLFHISRHFFATGRNRRSGRHRRPLRQGKRSFAGFGGLCLAVDAAIALLGPVRQTELVAQFLLSRGDAAGVLAVDDVHHPLRQTQVLALGQLAVLDDVDGDAGVDFYYFYILYLYHLFYF